MPFSVRRLQSSVAGRDQLFVRLESDSGAAAEFWPELGCNCVRWQAGGRDLIFAPPPDELAGRPTRGRIPVLFPFPNRIRAGRFAWDGREYQLPLNDSSHQNAIHGFTPREPWSVEETGADAGGAWLRASFTCPSDLWPAAGVLSLTVRLTENTLRYSAAVTNPTETPFPFGLGFHPYLAVTPDCRVHTPARQRWELVDGIPTGRRLPLDAGYDLRQPRPVGELNLDDAYTDLPDTPPSADGLIERGRVEDPGGGVLRERTSPAFRELVLFTPPHRKAVAVEPYTCPTDAIHLQEREDVGWRVLPPSGRWEGVVEYVWEAAS